MHALHMKIYADNAATTKLDADAFAAMIPWLTEDFANASQPYFFAHKPKAALKQAREIIAACINAEPQEIFFTSGGTESDNHAVKGIAFTSHGRKNFVTSAIEHKAVLNSCKALENFGHRVTYLQPDESCTITPKNLSAHVAADTALVSVMFANNELGTIQPIKELCEISHAQGALFHTDAVQAVGHVALDVKNLGVDMLSASAHKFNGPKGIGFLYVRRGVTLSAYLDGGGQEDGLRGGTENIAAIVGMAVALQKNISALEKNRQHLRELDALLMRELVANKIPHVRNGSANCLPGLISLSFDGRDGESILHRLDLAGISISTGSACDGKSNKISHVLQALNMPPRLAKGTIRISLGKDNTAQDVQKIVAALKKFIL